MQLAKEMLLKVNNMKVREKKLQFSGQAWIYKVQFVDQFSVQAWICSLFVWISGFYADASAWIQADWAW